jgi:ABC-2 type transport system permease protein
MRLNKALLIFKKDWREIKRNWQVIMPIIIVPLLLSVLLPTFIMLMPELSDMPVSASGDLSLLIENLPNHIKDELIGITDEQAKIYVISLYFFTPFFLIIPLMASSVIASDSFAGEKERKTIEALLATPLSDSELFLGKILVSFITSMIVTIISFIMYSIVVNTISFFIFNGKLLLPNLVWIMLVFGVAPTLALASIGLTVLISVRVKGFKEAQQISVVLILPILMLVFGQIFGIVIFGPLMVGLLIIILGAFDLLIFKLGVKFFNREEILSRLS